MTVASLLVMVGSGSKPLIVRAMFSFNIRDLLIRFSCFLALATVGESIAETWQCLSKQCLLLNSVVTGTQWAM